MCGVDVYVRVLVRTIGGWNSSRHVHFSLVLGGHDACGISGWCMWVMVGGWLGVVWGELCNIFGDVVWPPRDGWTNVADRAVS